MGIDSYQPAPEEITKAYDLITVQEKAMSELREQQALADANTQPAKPRPESDSLAVVDQATFNELINNYLAHVAEISERLKNQSTSLDETKELIQQKISYELKIFALKQNNPEFVNPDAKERQTYKEQELIKKLPEDLRTQFLKYIQIIPERLRGRYLSTLESILGNEDEVAANGRIHGLVFELSRIYHLIKQGLEQVDLDLEFPLEIEYNGFPKKVTDFSQERTQKLISPIHFDVPVIRNGQPYVYEVKSSSRIEFGSQANQRNQLLKYQAAIERGVVDGATIELRGRIDLGFLSWASGTSVVETGQIPDVEIIYAFELPSGGEYRFILKKSRKNNGLKFHNEGRLTTPEATLASIKEDDPERFEELLRKFGSEEIIINVLSNERILINCIQKSVLDRSIMEILTGVDIENPPLELAPYLADPTSIKSLALYDQYETLRKELIYKKLLAKRNIINVDNKFSSYSEFATREYVEKSLRGYQDYLTQNPEMARVKKAYILNGEDAIQTVIKKAMDLIDHVKDFEIQRMKAEENPENRTREIRRSMGYIGQPEGVALDIEHLIIDAISGVNKNSRQMSRSYSNPERFKLVESISDYLQNQDRRYLEITLVDPLSGATQKHTDLSEVQISRTQAELLKENIRRAQERVQQIMARYSELIQKESRDPQENEELMLLSGRFRAIKINTTNIETLKTVIESLRAEKTNRIKSETENVMKKRLAEVFDIRITQNMETLASLYKEVIGGGKEWDKIAQRIAEKIDQNIIKFIYIVNAAGEVIVDEEIVRGDVSGRAAHSELAQGKNVYGAGELVFSKDSNGQWILTEINNGSGHYRPSSLTLTYVRNLIETKGIDTTQSEIRDALLRGTPPPDLTILEE